MFQDITLHWGRQFEKSDFYNFKSKKKKNSAKEQIQIVLQYNRVKLYTPAPADFVTEYQKYKNTEFGQIAVQYIKTVMSYTNSCSKCGAFAAHDSALISLCPTLD